MAQKDWPRYVPKALRPATERALQQLFDLVHDDAPAADAEAKADKIPASIDDML